MAESVYAADLKSAGPERAVWVQVPSRAYFNPWQPGALLDGAREPLEDEARIHIGHGDIIRGPIRAIAAAAIETPRFGEILSNQGDVPSIVES